MKKNFHFFFPREVLSLSSWRVWGSYCSFEVSESLGISFLSKGLFPAQFINMKDDWELSCGTVFYPHPTVLMISPGVRRKGHWGRESGNTKTGVNSFGVRKARARFFRVVGIHLIEIKFRVKSKINSLSAYAVAFNHINQRWGSLNVKLELNALESTNITMLYISSH